MQRQAVELLIFRASGGRRPYFARVAADRCLILGGGSKRTQAADIQRARKWLEEARQQRGG
jgi:putative component of toxin-antitoxin plasmid stabilization module